MNVFNKSLTNPVDLSTLGHHSGLVSLLEHSPGFCQLVDHPAWPM